MKRIPTEELKPDGEELFVARSTIEPAVVRLAATHASDWELRRIVEMAAD